MKKGIDISIWQKDFTNLEVLKPNGIDFAILKISEGQSKDRAFEQHYSGMREVGMPTGVYVFSHATNTAKAKAEAEFALNILGGRKLELPIFMDLESSDINYGWNASIMPVALAFGEAVRAGGYKWGVYANRSWWQNKLDVQAVREAGGVVWCAEYGVAVPKLDCDIWQYADNGKIDGYAHKLDMNVMYKTSLLDGSDTPDTPIQPVEPVPVEGDVSKFPIVRFGDKSEYVWQLQTWLNQLGYELEPDSIFGPATSSAVNDFQAINGLTVDNVVGKMTWTKLAALAAKNPAEPETEYREPQNITSVKLPALGKGMKGEAVSSLQVLLTAMGYYKGENSGLFDEATKKAVMGFEADKGFDTDGIVDADDWAALIGGG